VVSAATVEITAPGVYPEMPNDVYLADPVAGGSLSHSGAKTLIKKTPALFAYEREHGRPDKRTFDFGHAAHQAVLGVGPQIVAVEASDWRTKAAQQQRDEIRAEGAVPVLADELATVVAMAEALHSHPAAAKLLKAGSGQPEVSAFARDPETGVMLRCRYDWLRPAESGRLLLVDFKTAASADEDSFSKAADAYGYDIQDAWYSEIARLLALADDVAFLFVVQEKTPPYLVNVIELNPFAKQIGAIRRREAITTYAECSASGNWRGYGDDIAYVALPPWVERQFEDRL
jgi:hypothetical protein